MTSQVKNETFDRLSRVIRHRAIWWAGAVAALAAIAIPALDSSEAADTTSPRTAPAVQASRTSILEEGPSASNDRWLDHSVVNVHSTAHESDLPGASIAEWGP